MWCPDHNEPRAGRGRAPSWGLLGLLTNQCSDVDLKHEGEIVEPLEQHAPPTVLELDELVPAEPGLEGQCLLCEPEFETKPTNVGADATT